MTSLLEIDRTKLTLEQRFEIVMTNLNAAYAKLRPGATREDFKAAVAFNVRDMGHLGRGDAVLRLLRQLREHGLPVDESTASIYVSCAYAIQAMQALKHDNEPELAGALMIDAFYWCGTLTNVGEAQKLREAVLSEQAAKGAHARGDRYRPIREWAYKLASERGRWSSRNQAAMHIAGILRHKPPSKDWPKLAEAEAHKTISKWLKAHPDAQKLFGGQEKKQPAEAA